MTTFNELKERTTPEIIKKMVELAEGETFDSDFINWLESHVLELFDLKILFPLLLHRAVEGWNEKNNCMVHVIIKGNRIEYGTFDEKQSYYFKDYQPCHLTPCEMAILDCLIEVMK